MSRFAFRDRRGLRASITRNREPPMPEPIEPQFHATMNALAHGLDEIFNGPQLPGLPRSRRVGFVLMAFEIGKTEGGRVNYISNAERADMIVAMKEWLARAEGSVADTPNTPK